MTELTQYEFYIPPRIRPFINDLGFYPYDLNEILCVHRTQNSKNYGTS